MVILAFDKQHREFGVIEAIHDFLNFDHVSSDASVGEGR